MCYSLLSLDAREETPSPKTLIQIPPKTSYHPILPPHYIDYKNPHLGSTLVGEGDNYGFL